MDRQTKIERERDRWLEAYVGERKPVIEGRNKEKEKRKEKDNDRPIKNKHLI